MNDVIHGGNPLEAFKKYSISPRSVIDFSVNINPLGPPAALKEKWEELFSKVSHYPTLGGDRVKAFYKNRFKLEEENILPGNGSIELIYLVARVLKVKKIAIVQPGFQEYKRAFFLNNAKIVPITLSVKNEFKPLPGKFLRKYLKDVNAVFLGNPNNPTATIFSRELVYKLAQEFSDVFFLVDEAFIQFVDKFENLTLLNKNFIRPNIIVFHSLTKFYSLPGLRLGALISHSETIKLIKKFKEPWSVNSLAEVVAESFLYCQEYEETTRQLIAIERRKIKAGLKEFSAVKLYPSKINFYLAQWLATNRLDDLIKPLLMRGFYVRDCRNFSGLEDNFFRFAIRTPEENERFLCALKNIIY